VILVDTSIWNDHWRNRDERLTRLLESGQVLVHPFVVGELALGNLLHRQQVLTAL
jgi:predicted nucleic acid-binding protein